MTQKPKIQYIGDFYVSGSAAQAVARQQRKKPKTQLPMERHERIEKIYVDPVALVGIVVALFMLVVMVMGAVRIHDDWQAYQRMEDHLVSLRQKNGELVVAYRASYDLDDIRSKAEGMGLIPRADVKTQVVRVTPPAPKVEQTWKDDVKWFFEGLFDKG